MIVARQIETNSFGVSQRFFLLENYNFIRQTDYDMKCTVLNASPRPKTPVQTRICNCRKLPQNKDH